MTTSSVLWAMPRSLYHFYLRRRMPRFCALKEGTSGMLPAAIYKRIYDRVRALPDLDIVEVGGAAGAASVAIALAMKESGKSSRLIVVEKCEGGSRRRYGGYSDNLRKITDNFRKFGVEDRIVLYPHELTLERGPDVLQLVRTPEIAALVHDADGHLHRDFWLFWPRLRDGGLIVVDDDERHGTRKQVITHALLRYLIEQGLFEPDFRMRNTVFGHKPAGADISRLDLEACRRRIAEHAPTPA